MMNQNNMQALEQTSESLPLSVGDDYGMTRVPFKERHPLFSIMMVRIGALTCISQFMLGAALGYGMTLWDAFLATLLGSVILQVVSLCLGIAGAREGMGTSLLSVWSGFGRYGSSLIGIIIAISLTGWFGVQNAVFAEGINNLLGHRPGFVFSSVIAGALTIFLVYFGFRLLHITAKITVPLFAIVMIWGIYVVLRDHSLFTLATMAAPGPALTLGAATTMVSGGFIVGCVTTPDITRFARSGRDVFWITFIGTLIGEFGVNLIAVLMAHAVGSADIMAIVLQLTGLVGGLIVALATIKINDINLYSSSLGIVTFCQNVLSIRLSRGALTIALGILGTLLSVIGILDAFIPFLIILGVAIPPIAGIITVDYFILQTSRKALEDTRKTGTLPTAYRINFVALAAWAIGFLAGYFITWGVQSLTSILVSSLAYYLGMKLFGHKAIV